MELRITHQGDNHIAKGKHTIQIIRGTKEGDLECGNIIVTNDFGFLATDGSTSFLPLPAEQSDTAHGCPCP